MREIALVAYVALVVVLILFGCAPLAPGDVRCDTTDADGRAHCEVVR